MTLFDVVLKHMKGNLRNYVLYFLSMLFSVVIYYTFVSLQYSSEIIRSIESSESMQGVFMAASAVLLLFVAVFILYSNQFFARRRKKEIGLYALFGFPKKRIGRMLFYENLLISAAVLVLGIGIGTFLSKLFSMMFIRLLGIAVDVGMTFSLPALLQTVIVFMALAFLTSFQAYRMIYKWKLVELFRAEQEGEPAPAASMFSAGLAVLCLAAGYGFAFRDWATSEEVLLNLGAALGGIIIGTVWFFSSLVILLLKAMKRNKRFYYRGLNLISTSNLVYRMKGNARTLSVISLLSAAALCAFSVGVGMYYGYEKTARLTAPFSFMLLSEDSAFLQEADRIIRSDEAHPVIAQLAIPVVHVKGEASSPVVLSESERRADDHPLKVISISEYNRAAAVLGYAPLDGIEPGGAVAIRPMYTSYEWPDYEGETITVQLPEESISFEMVGMVKERVVHWRYPDVMVIVPDESFRMIASQVPPVTYTGYIVEGQETSKETADALAAIQTPESHVWSFYSVYRLGIEDAAFNVFILGFLGFVFVLSTGSIIYFKQLSEAVSDQPRYGILRKIGVSRREIGALILKQNALVFLLPLIVGLAHFLVILHLLKRLFSNLAGVSLTIPVLVCVAGFIGIYAMYYVAAVNSIGKLVNGEVPRGVRGLSVLIAVVLLVLMGMILAWEPPKPVKEAHVGEKIHLALPAPTGAFPVGTADIHLVDETRKDPWAGEKARELMISLWYPACEAGGRKAFYMQPGAAQYYDENVIPTIGLDPGRIDLAGIDTHAWWNAPVAHGEEGWPVLFYSPGASVPRSFGTVIAADLASRGYVIVTVDHTYETSVSAFPDGRVVTQASLNYDAETVLKVLDVRVDDIRFVLDWLEGIHPDAEHGELPAGFQTAFDLSKVGIFGHSAGGATAAQSMYEDERIDAGISMDSTFGFLPDHLLPVAEHGLDRPFMLMNAGYNDDGEADSHLTAKDQASFWEQSTGWKLDLSIPKGAHFTFTDYQVLLPQLSRHLSLSPQVLHQSIGSADPDQMLQAQRNYIAAFFDLHLKGIPQPLLLSPSPEYPDVEFVE